MSFTLVICEEGFLLYWWSVETCHYGQRDIGPQIGRQLDEEYPFRRLPLTLVDSGKVSL